MNKLTVALTGSSSFLGKHLADRFISDGHKVAGIPRELLLSPVDLEAYLQEIKPNYIFHLASYGNMYDQKDEDEIFSTNIIKTYFLLKASLKLEYSALINVSSSSVYGQKSSPMNERDILDTETMYGVTKASAEYLVRYFAKKYDKPMVTVRPFSICGIGEQESHLIPTLIRSSLEGKKVNLVPDATHDFVDVEDVVDAMLMLSLYAKDHIGEVFNIGTGTFWTNEQVKDIVEYCTGKDIKTNTVQSLRSYDSLKWVADPTNIKMMGWFPRKDLEQSIKEMVEFYKHENRTTKN